MLLLESCSPDKSDGAVGLCLSGHQDTGAGESWGAWVGGGGGGGGGGCMSSGHTPGSGAAHRGRGRMPGLQSYGCSREEGGHQT